MSKYGFLDVLEEEMDKVFPFDFEINWDKKNHAVEVAFLLEAQNTGGVALVDEAGEESDEDIFFEEAVHLLQSSQVSCGRRCLFNSDSL